MNENGEPSGGSPAADSLLVLRAGAIGDFVLTLPALAALRARFPRHRLVLAARAEVLPLVHGTLVDDALPFDSPLLTPLFAPAVDAEPSPALQARLGNLDLAVVWLPAASARIVAGNLRSLGAARLLSAPPQRERVHAADHLVESLAPLGIIQPDRVPHLALPEDARASAAELWERLAPGNGRVVAIHPGSGGAPKRWETARFVELARRLSAAGIAGALWLSGPAEVEAGIAAPSDIPVITSPALPLLTALLARCALYVGNDSGITHLAAALGLPLLALFGPTDPALWGPRGSRVRILRHPGGSLADLSCEEVYAALNQML